MSDMNGLISVVIPNFNYARFLPRSIDSILAQKDVAYEIVVVDDASTDESADVIASYEKDVQKVLKRVNGGHGAAFNSGYERAAGDIVMFLDADDWLYPDALSKVASAYEPDVAVYQYRLDLVDGDGVRFDQYPQAEAAFEDGDVKQNLLQRGRFATTVTSGLAFSREALSQVMPIPAEAFRQGGDGYLVTVAPLYGRVKTLPGVLGAYCQHGGNHSQFAQAVAKKARWRLEHDEARYTELRRHAAHLGLAVAAAPGLADPIHLEERMASLRLEPDAHAYPDDRPRSLARQGEKAARSAPLPPRRRMFLRLWWMAAGWLPRWAASAVISWKLSAASRPAWVGRLAKLMRGAAASRPAAAR